MAMNTLPINNEVIVGKKKPSTLLGELRAGQLFRYNKSGPVYMKTELYSGSKQGMVNLKNGAVYYNEAFGAVEPIIDTVQVVPGQ